ncbi:MAG: LysR family transcriptional regulator, partial [Comamonas sp.]|nr:LysR family transcriptional regulator [Comamonas sp.]
MDISGLDLNLLKVFDAVFRHRSVSRAADELGLSQPAASQALTRLRVLLHNPLFERMHGGVRPTPCAERLAHSVQAALATL